MNNLENDNPILYKAAITSAVLDNAQGRLVIPIGESKGGNLVIQDMSEIPNMLVCGYTGSGKTAFVQSLIVSLCTRYSPDEIQFLICDSKIADYKCLGKVPHLCTDIVTENRKASGAIEWLLIETKKRQRLFYELSVNDIVQYNKICEIIHKDKLPDLYLIIDDYSLFFNTYDISDIVLQLTKIGRNSGIHLILVTSSAVRTVLNKELLANIPCRVTFCLTSKDESRLILGEEGGEKLNAPGELLFRWRSNIKNCFALLIADEDLKSISISLSQKYRTIKNDDEKIANVHSDTDDKYDTMLSEAIEIAIEMKQISVSMLQRRLKLNYSRAARIVDQMEELGIIGPYEGAKPRMVLVNHEEWDNISKKQKNINNHINREIKSNRFCSVCGSPLLKNAKYCTQCGSKAFDIV